MTRPDVLLAVAELPIVAWPTMALKPTFSPRIPLVDEREIQALARALEDLPPIVVHIDSGAIVDGVHRWEAFRRAGRARIRARAFAGSSGDATLLAIQLNLACGRPLSRLERRHAVVRVLQAFPDRSDRWIAEACEVSHSTVALLRPRAPALSPDAGPQLRIGRDGRRRPAVQTARPENRSPA